jgi:hypothetical protein
MAIGDEVEVTYTTRANELLARNVSVTATAAPAIHEGSDPSEGWGRGGEESAGK